MLNERFAADFKWEDSVDGAAPAQNDIELIDMVIRASNSYS